ncbi:MAG: hypothetical protein M1830_001347 [Pleopsidium flavum]|nr:MAG: hypothetical protein M1830_001347 [Pleopsidium flavum]
MVNMRRLLTRIKSASSSGSNDSDLPREPPPPATPLSFPAYIPPNSQASTGDGSIQYFVKLFAALKKPSDVTAEHLDALNVRVTRDVALDDLLPRLCLPPLSWREAPAKLSENESIKLESKLSNGAAAPGHDIYYARLQELLFDNDAAFRRILRQPQLPGQQPVSPAHFRKFWVNLELMSEYWDTSLDNDIDVSSKAVTQPHNDNIDVDELRADPDKGSGKGAKKTYKGRRIGTGSQMPEIYRDDTVRYFVETIAWAFGCQVTTPRMPPRLSLKNCLLPVRHNSLVYRSPTDRQRARQGIVEGPVTAIQCRPDTSFRSPGGAIGEGWAEKLDLLREVGGMLLLAQQRAREGQEEKSPGEGKWWTTKPRWGGGAGGEVSNPAENSDEGPPPAKRGKKRESALESYKALNPPSGIWEKKVTYLRIGKDRNSEHDTIFMISSLNHHISILHMLVHPDYLQYLTTGSIISSPSGTLPPSDITPRTQYILEMRRSRWYDLFEAEDRVEAMIGVWGVMAWLMRAET